MWGIYTADYLATRGHSPPSSPFQFYPIFHLTHEDILLGTLNPTSWTWANKTQTPILGSLRSTVGLRRLPTTATPTEPVGPPLRSGPHPLPASQPLSGDSLAQDSAPAL